MKHFSIPRQNYPQFCKKHTPKNEKVQIPASLTIPDNSVHIVTLGGIGLIGENMTAIEYHNEILLLDCGISFCDIGNISKKISFPDSYFSEKKIVGLVISHGHEDHIGGIPYLLSIIPYEFPIYATKYTLTFLKNKMVNQMNFLTDSSNCSKKLISSLVPITENFKIPVSLFFSLTAIHVNHSIPYSTSLFIDTPCGGILFSGDFKLSSESVYEGPYDKKALAALGDSHKVNVLLCESTNANIEGHSKSEEKICESFDKIFEDFSNKELIFVSFASNIFRIKTIIEKSIKNNRKVLILGKSFYTSFQTCEELQEILAYPSSTFINNDDIDLTPKRNITIIATGSQGEPLAALSSTILKELETSYSSAQQTAIIFSSSIIPGNEKLVDNLVNRIMATGCTCIQNNVNGYLTHVSGHGKKEDIQEYIGLVKPNYFIPIHGETHHLLANKKNAVAAGISPDCIKVPSANGSSFCLSSNGTLSEENPVFVQNLYFYANSITPVPFPVISKMSEAYSFGYVSVVVVINATSNQKKCAVTALGFSDEKIDKINHLVNSICLKETSLTTFQLTKKIKETISFNFRVGKKTSLVDIQCLYI